MMFTQREDTHARYADDLISGYRAKGCVRLARIIFDKLAPPVGPAARCVHQSFTVRIFAQRQQQFPPKLYQSGVIDLFYQMSFLRLLVLFFGRMDGVLPILVDVPVAALLILIQVHYHKR